MMEVACAQANFLIASFLLNPSQIRRATSRYIVLLSTQGRSLQTIAGSYSSSMLGGKG